MELSKLGEWKEAVEVEIQNIKNKIQSLNAELQNLNSELQKKSQQLDLICRLMDSESNPFRADAEVTSAPSQNLPTSAVVTPNEVKDRVYQILSEARRPMNIKEIHAEFLRRGYPIPGKGTHFNILVHIGRELKKGRNGRFQRDGRGTYSLRSIKVGQRKK